MSNAYRPHPPREQPRARTAAAATAAPASYFRSPKDDAPEYDPTLWSVPDNSYISTLRAHLLTQQQQPDQQPASGTHSAAAASARPETFLTSSWRGTQKPLTAAELAERRGLFHVLGRSGPVNMLCGCISWMCPTLYARWYPELTVGDVHALPAQELARLMQLSLAAGEVEQSAMLARELSRRKLALQMELFPSRAEMPAHTAEEEEERRRAFNYAGTAPRGSETAPPPPQGSAASSGLHLRAEGFSPARGSWQPGQDAYYADPHHAAGTYASSLRGPSHWAGNGGGAPAWGSSPSAAIGKIEGSSWGPGPNWN